MNNLIKSINLKSHQTAHPKYPAIYIYALPIWKINERISYTYTISVHKANSRSRIIVAIWAKAYSRVIDHSSVKALSRSLSLHRRRRPFCLTNPASLSITLTHRMINLECSLAFWLSIGMIASRIRMSKSTFLIGPSSSTFEYDGHALLRYCTTWNIETGAIAI